MFLRVSVRRENMVKSSSSSVSSQQHDLGSLPVGGSTVFNQLHVACDIGLSREGGALSVFLPLTSLGGCDVEWGGALRVLRGGSVARGVRHFSFAKKCNKSKCSLVNANPAVRTDHLDFTSATDLLTQPPVAPILQRNLKIFSLYQIFFGHFNICKKCEKVCQVD